jgi:hypothetical protein
MVFGGKLFFGRATNASAILLSSHFVIPPGRNAGRSTPLRSGPTASRGRRDDKSEGSGVREQQCRVERCRTLPDFHHLGWPKGPWQLGRKSIPEGHGFSRGIELLPSRALEAPEGNSDRTETVPQRLKPGSARTLYGTAKAMPFRPTSPPFSSPWVAAGP